MKRLPKYYAIGWTLAFAIFNVIAFVVPVIRGTTFWIGYGAIALAFIGHLILSLLALQSDSREKLFYQLPLITVSYTGLIVMLVTGGLVMAIPAVPYWVGIPVCALVLIITAFGVLKAKAAAEIVSEIDQRVVTKTAFIYAKTVEAENLLAEAKSDEAKALAKKVFEAFRYSDPMSGKELEEIEGSIASTFTAFEHAVLNSDLDTLGILSERLLTLIGNRNRLCKASKRSG